MPSVWDSFNDSFIKSAFKPGSDSWYGSPFQPDRAYGANMLPGSESMNPTPGRDMANGAAGWFGAGGALSGLVKNLMGGSTAKPMSALSGSGSPLTIPAGTQFGDVAPTLSNVPVTDVQSPSDIAATNLGLGVGSALLQRLFPSASPAIDAAGSAAKTGVDVMGAASGNPMSMVALPFDAFKNISSIARLFR